LLGDLLPASKWGAQTKRFVVEQSLALRWIVPMKRFVADALSVAVCPLTHVVVVV
jgi:hypothetical protein